MRLFTVAAIACALSGAVIAYPTGDDGLPGPGEQWSPFHVIGWLLEQTLGKVEDKIVHLGERDLSTSHGSGRLSPNAPPEFMAATETTERATLNETLTTTSPAPTRLNNDASQIEPRTGHGLPFQWSFVFHYNDNKGPSTSEHDNYLGVKCMPLPGGKRFVTSYEWEAGFFVLGYRLYPDRECATQAIATGGDATPYPRFVTLNKEVAAFMTYG